MKNSSKYQFDVSKGGLIWVQKNGFKLICDSIPFDIHAERYTDAKNGRVWCCATFCLKRAAMDGGVDISERISVETKALEKRNFIEAFSERMIIAPGQTKNVAEIFRFLIKTSLRDAVVEEKSVLSWGWNGNAFYAEENDDSNLLGDAYGIAVQIAELMRAGRLEIIAAILDGMHGFVKKPLFDAGIRHDYGGLYVGKTGTGKTSIVRDICQSSRPNFFSLNSGFKVLKEVAAADDMTIIFDDNCKTMSVRNASNLAQAFYALLQQASDSGAMVLDGKKAFEKAGVIGSHLVFTSEIMPKNISSLNRSFLVEMDESIEKPVHFRIEEMAKKQVFSNFFLHLTSVISGERYEDEVSKIAADYKCYIEEPLIADKTGSANRINATYAVQMTKIALVERYFCTMQIPVDVRNQALQACRKAVRDACYDLRNLILQIQGDQDKMRYMKPLTKLFKCIGFKDDAWHTTLFIAESEKQFFGSRRHYVAAFLHDGYLNVRAKQLCDVLKERDDSLSDITPRALIKELRHHSLIRLDKDGGASFQWGEEKKRWIHINIRQLFELVYDSDELKWEGDFLNQFSEAQVDYGDPWEDWYANDDDV